MSSDYTLMTFSNNRIAFPVADAGFTVDDSWAFFNADTVGDTSPAVDPTPLLIPDLGFSFHKS